MDAAERVEAVHGQQRRIEVAQTGDELLGPLKLLPGTWKGQGTGWNAIALPFAVPDETPGPPFPPPFRLLLNQYDEVLSFSLVDKGVPNRGLSGFPPQQADQFLVALDYEQVVHQIKVVDEPPSDVRGDEGAAIHHEPGLFLNMLNELTDGLDIARLATIPHGDALTALGRSSEVEGVVEIRPVNGLPVGILEDLDDEVEEDNDYLAPYRLFHDAPFKGTVDFPGFPGFDPVEPHHLLNLANQGVSVARTTVLDFDSTLSTGGIRNIPFVVKQADAATMKSTFWIQELEPDENGEVGLRLQYMQVVMLDFFPRRDGAAGRIGWPHVSINTLQKVSEEPAEPYEMTTAAE